MLVMSQDGTIVINADNAVFFLELNVDGTCLVKAKVDNIEYPLSDYLSFREAQMQLKRIYNHYEHNKRAIQICAD